MKNKLFFFANSERTKREQIAPVREFSVATDALRRGDFSGTGVTIFDPASNPDPALRTPFPGNIIPQDRIDPASIEMMRRLPAPTASGFTNNYRAQGTEDFERDNNDFKVNFHPNGRLSLFGRYSYSPSLIFDPPALGEAGGDALAGGQLGRAPGRTHVVGFGGTYAFGPALLLDANFGYTLQNLGAEGPDLGTNFGLDVLRIPGTNGPDRLQSGMPSFQVNGWANMGNPNTGNPFQFDDKQYVATVNVAWFKGSARDATGFDYSNQQLNHFQPQGGTFQTARGTFQFNGNATRLQNAAAPADSRFNSWADFLLGLPNGAGKVEQLRNPNSVYMQVYCRLRAGSVAAHPRSDVERGSALGVLRVAHARRRASASPASIRMTATSIRAGWRTCRSTRVSISDPGNSCRGSARLIGSATRRCCAPATVRAQIRSPISNSATPIRSTSRGLILRSRSTG